MRRRPSDDTGYVRSGHRPVPVPARIRSGTPSCGTGHPGTAPEPSGRRISALAAPIFQAAPGRPSASSGSRIAPHHRDPLPGPQWFRRLFAVLFPAALVMVATTSSASRSLSVLTRATGTARPGSAGPWIRRPRSPYSGGRLAGPAPCSGCSAAPARPAASPCSTFSPLSSGVRPKPRGSSAACPRLGACGCRYEARAQNASGGSSKAVQDAVVTEETRAKRCRADPKC